MACPWEEIIAASKQETFDNFLRYMGLLPAPGTDAWLLARAGERGRPVVGASEVGDLIFNPNNKSKPRQWAEERLDTAGAKKRFTGSHATRWGNFFEPIAFDVLEVDLAVSTGKEAKLYECGSIPGHVYKGNVVQRCTPDRIGMVGEQIVYYEAKCPISRVPNGKIPKAYMHQIQTGLFTVRICEKATFVDTMFETAPGDVGRDYHGYAVFYGRSDASKELPENSSDFTRKRLPVIVDTAGIVRLYEVEGDNDPVFKSLLFEVVNQKSLKVRYSKPYKAGLAGHDPVNMDADVTADVKTLDRPVAVVYWRMVDSRRVDVTREEGYAEKLVPRLEKLMDNMAEAARIRDDESLTDEEKSERLNQIFPEGKKRSGMQEDMASQVHDE